MRLDSTNYVAGTTVDTAEVRRIADRIEGAAELIDDALRKNLALLAFDGARAGRADAARGAAVRAGLDRLATELSQWSRATVEIAVALCAGVDRYADAELYAAARIA